MGKASVKSIIGPLANSLSPGAMSAAQNNKLAGLANPGWFDSQISLFQTAAPGVSIFRQRDFSHDIPSGLADKNVAGGGAWDNTPNTNPTITNYVVPNLSIGPWAFSYRGTLPVPVNSCGVMYGFVLPLQGGEVAMGSQYASGGDGRDHTCLVAIISPIAWSPVLLYGPVLDGSVHTYSLAFNVTANTVGLYVDGTPVATLANATAYLPVATSKLFISVSGATALEHYITDIAWAV